MWREWGARPKGLATAQISASAFCAGRAWEAGGRNIVEQISTNLSVPVRDSAGKPPLLRRLSHRSAQFSLHSGETLEDRWEVDGEG